MGELMKKQLFEKHRVPARGIRVLEKSLLPEQPRRWRYFGMGLLLQAVMVWVMVVVSVLLLPKSFNLKVAHWTTSISLSPPEPLKLSRHISARHAPIEPAAVTAPVVDEEEEAQSKPAIKPVVSKPIAPQRRNLIADTPDIPSGLSVSNQIPALGVPDIPNLKKPKEPVKLDEFGDAGGFRGSEGGTLGAAGHVTPAGFTPGLERGMGTRTGRLAVQQNLFASNVVDPPAHRTQAEPKSNPENRPAEVISKPRPIYTDEARARKIEGVVTLSVLFTASGQVGTVQVIQGLGYGLDEAAEAAARHIQFRPALRGGKPTDSTVTVHIVFELAY